DSLEAGDSDPLTPPVDTDADGIPDFQDPDSDGDGLPDSAGVGVDGVPIDTNGDGIPDYVDTDDDGDGIPDLTEGAATLVDTDRDGTPDYLDLDSDGDSLLDADEGIGDPDLDGIPNFRDFDSDNDGLPDLREAMLGTNPLSDDSDGDGIPDLIESVAPGADPLDAAVGIPADDFYFILPYLDPSQDGLLTFSTDLQQADVFFSVDTTGSFGEEIAEIQASIDTLIVPGVSAAIPMPAFGVGRFEDFPRDPYGIVADLPFELLQPVTADLALLGLGIDALPPAFGGLDVPEAGVEALYQWATGRGIPEVELAPFWPGDIGGAGFRADSLPIIVHITDAISHMPADYAPAGIAAHGIPEALGALGDIRARVIGVRSVENDGTADDPYDELVELALGTNATIPPVAGECATGIDGAPRAPVMSGGVDVCPLVFDVRTDGTGLGAIVVDAITQLASFGTLDVSTRPVGEAMGLRGEILPAGTSTADFIQSILPEPPAPAGTTIDGPFFRNVTPGTSVDFRVTVQNDFVPQTVDAQLFTIGIEVLGDGVTVLDLRNVYVIVPPDTTGPVLL
ncbi:MAG: hypothetical protein OEY14_02510, partial [Myxococcales bacterium]|nr:hypothetical protein [Myxococcales bacterium]